MMNRDFATVVPVAQLTEIMWLSDFTGMMVRTMNSEFFQKGGLIVRSKSRNKNITLEFVGTFKQEMMIPKFVGLGIKSSDSNDKVI
jgi:hypothetical protein